MSKMTYAEAAKRAVDVWYSAYNEECDNDPAREGKEK